MHLIYIFVTTIKWLKKIKKIKFHFNFEIRKKKSTFFMIFMENLARLRFDWQII